MTVTVPIDPTSQGCVRPPDTIVIGALLPLSSPGAMRSGFAMQAALSIAVNDLNAVGGIAGRQIQLVTYDTAGIPSRGAKFAQRLILYDCALAIVGIYHSNVAFAVRNVTDDYDIPLILAEPAADILTGQESRTVFRLTPASAMLNSMDARWLAEVGDYNGDGLLGAVVVVPDNLYGQHQMAQAERWMPQFDIHVKTLVADLPTEDFSPVVARLVAMKMAPDVVFIEVPDEDALHLQRQLLDAGIGPTKGTLIVNRAALDDERFWAAIPDGVGTVAPQIGPWPSTATAMGHLFAVSYLRYFDRWPERYAFAAYDALMLAADGIERANSFDAADILASLEASDTELASGIYSFWPADAWTPAASSAWALPAAGEESISDQMPDYLWRQWPEVQTLYLQYTEAHQPAEQMAVIWPAWYRTVDGPYVRP